MIAQRFIAGWWHEYESSPSRDERTHASGPILLSPLRGSDRFDAQPTVETVGYFQLSLSGLRDPCLMSFDLMSNTGSSRLDCTEYRKWSGCVAPSLNTYGKACAWSLDNLRG